MTEVMLTKNDATFLSFVKEKGWVVDAVQGKVFDAAGKERGSRSKKAFTISMYKDGDTFIITRARAIWVATHGAVPVDYGVGHQSNDRFDDRLSNLELSTSADRSRKSAASENWSLANMINRDSKLTVDQVNEARREAHADPKINYEVLAKKYGVSRPTMIAALKGASWQHASEPVVTIRKGRNSSQEEKDRNKAALRIRQRDAKREKRRMEAEACGKTLRAAPVKKEKKPRLTQEEKVERIRLRREQNPKPPKPEKPPRKKREAKAPVVQMIPVAPGAPVYGSFDDARRVTKSLLQNNINITPFGVLKFLRMRGVPNVDKFPVRIITEIKMELVECQN